MVSKQFLVDLCDEILFSDVDKGYKTSTLSNIWQFDIHLENLSCRMIDLVGSFSGCPSAITIMFIWATLRS